MQDKNWVQLSHQVEYMRWLRTMTQEIDKLEHAENVDAWRVAVDDQLARIDKHFRLAMQDLLRLANEGDAMMLAAVMREAADIIEEGPTRSCHSK